MSAHQAIGASPADVHGPIEERGIGPLAEQGREQSELAAPAMGRRRGARNPSRGVGAPRDAAQISPRIAAHSAP